MKEGHLGATFPNMNTSVGLPLPFTNIDAVTEQTHSIMWSENKAMINF